MQFSRSSKRWFKAILSAVVLLASVYGSGRLYYRVTDGFAIGNITSSFAYDPRWDVRSLVPSENQIVESVLDQKFLYLGKGCQSYVFLSEDGDYVLKFFKYQRFRPQQWLDYFAFIPAVDRYRLAKIEKKKNKREGVFASWKIAFEELKEETGLVFVHLNKSSNLNRELTLFDKMGLEHRVNLDQMEFLIQRKAKMLCASIRELMEKERVLEAKNLITDTIELVMSEYRRGLADNDHALMQNTGVYEGKPVHIDVGQFVHNPEIKDPSIYKQELFTKTYKFHIWLKQEYPELAQHLERLLYTKIGPQFANMQPIFKPHA